MKIQPIVSSQTLILLVHFNIKLWVPLINHHLWDEFYWQADEMMRPLINFLFDIHRRMDWLFPINGNFYMIGFIGMFYASFCYHAIQSEVVFRKLFLAALFFQGLGALSYLAFPALGPFIFEPGISEPVRDVQMAMLDVHRDIVTHGGEWLIENGSANLMKGLGAMPSLHAGGSFLFLLFACKYGRVLVPLYAIIFSYILMGAITTRWHYLLDLPVGMALAWVSMMLAEKCGASVMEKGEEPLSVVYGVAA